jgi:hypothetical protein
MLQAQRWVLSRSRSRKARRAALCRSSRSAVTREVVSTTIASTPAGLPASSGTGE